MNATALLKTQHRKVETLFKKLEGGRSDPKVVLEELANSLAAHMAIEHEFFYPAVKEVDEDIVNESYEEHSLAEVALKRLIATDVDDESFNARVSALKELILHHMRLAGGNRSQAARTLGVSRDGLRYKMKRYGLT